MNMAEYWKSKRVVVTGGAGFLGSNLAIALASAGAAVAALDGFLFGGGANEYNLPDELWASGTGRPGIALVHGDLREIDLRPLCEGADVIFNLAAQTSHMGGQTDPAADIAINVTAQMRLIQAVREAAPNAVIVHASTRQFYGRVDKLPVDERQPVAPVDVNGISKFAGEQYWMLEHRVRDRPVVSLRLTNCYGPRLRIRDARQSFLGIWIRRCMEGVPFEVWDGRQQRDMAYVDDVTRAFLAAAGTPACYGRIFNIGGAPPVTLLELAERLVAAADQGKRLPDFVQKHFPADRARIDIGSYYADDSAFREATGWAPQVNLDTGLQKTLQYYWSHWSNYV